MKPRSIIMIGGKNSGRDTKPQGSSLRGSSSKSTTHTIASSQRRQAILNGASSGLKKMANRPFTIILQTAAIATPMTGIVLFHSTLRIEIQPRQLLRKQHFFIAT